MAIVVGEEKNKLSFVAIGGFVVVFAILITATYYFFFAPAPLAERIAPVELQEASELSKVTIDVTKVTDLITQLGLEPQIAPVKVGELGRENPFLTF
ncbi:MAG: hypothetical protein HYS87_00290 [Candidatus Colwellbacteria bacterium]|nr:hypothetical protein [Candidatus Colwellbacteria bacterium]